MAAPACKGRHRGLGAKDAHGGGWYSRGYKRCSVCLIWLRWDGVYCPCCSVRLSYRARRARHKPGARRAA